MYTTREADMKQTAVRIPEDTYRRLQEMADKTGRTATFYIREAVETHIDDLEDIYMAEQVLARRESEGAKSYSLAQLSEELGLDD